jgi:hypothetical protein
MDKQERLSVLIDRVADCDRSIQDIVSNTFLVSEESVSSYDTIKTDCLHALHEIIDIVVSSTKPSAISQQLSLLLSDVVTPDQLRPTIISQSAVICKQLHKQLIAHDLVAQAKEEKAHLFQEELSRLKLCL